MTQVKPPPPTMRVGEYHKPVSGHGCAGYSAYEFMGSIESVGEIPDAKYNNRKNQSNMLTQRYTQKASIINYMGLFAHIKKLVVQRAVARCLLIQPCPVTFLPGDSISFCRLRF